MSESVRMPHACPACERPLYATDATRPRPGPPPAAALLFLLAGTVSVATYFALLLAMRGVLRMKVGDIPNSDYAVYRVPPTWMLSLVALPVALVPGFLLGRLAARLPHAYRLRCQSCNWSANYPATATWLPDSPPTSPDPAPPASADCFHALASVVDDTADPWKEATAWAYAEIRTGRLPEDVAADLIAQGWPPDEVEGMVEQCRRQTRGRR